MIARTGPNVLYLAELPPEDQRNRCDAGQPYLVLPVGGHFCLADVDAATLAQFPLMEAPAAAAVKNKQRPHQREHGARRVCLNFEARPCRKVEWALALTRQAQDSIKSAPPSISDVSNLWLPQAAKPPRLAWPSIGVPPTFRFQNSMC